MRLRTTQSDIESRADSDLPQPSSGAERWSYNFHLSLLDGRKVSVFVSFYRMPILSSTVSLHIDVSANQRPGSVDEKPYQYAHVVNYAISVPPTISENAGAPPSASSKGHYHVTSGMDTNYLDYIRRTFEGDTRIDSFIRNSYLSTLSDGKIPLPDTLILGDVSILTQGTVRLKYGDFASVVCRKNNDGDDVYHVTANSRDGLYGFELEFISQESVHHELNGFSPECSLVSHCEVAGTVLLDNSQVAVESHDSYCWYERESGRNVEAGNERTIVRTEPSWISIFFHLSDGRNLNIYQLWDTDIYNGDTTLRDKKGLLISADNRYIVCDDFNLETLESWTSMTTLNEYGTKWKLVIPELQLDVSIEAAFAQQEFGTITAGRGYWKGRVHITGTMGAERVLGIGFVENRPAQCIVEFEKHLKRVAYLTTLEVSRFYPDHLISPEHAIRSLGLCSSSSDLQTDDPLRYMEHVSLDVLHERLCAPVRHLINGSGKSWRSYLLMLSLTALGTDPEPFRPLLAGVELVHTGTLIIDDIEDESPVRRGVPAVHTVWGVATAINAGEAAYFAFHTTLQSVPDLPLEKKLGLLDIFFETMRFAHAGQALDIAGQQQTLLNDIIAGHVHPSVLEKTVLSIHRLKTALVARNIARISGILAGASKAQTIALEKHCEQMGIAFQIIDDVYDIRRGSLAQNKKESQRMTNQQPLKRRWDDIRSGKISIPIAKAGQMMPLDEAQWVWETVLSKPGDDDIVQKVVDKLETYGIVDACISEAQKLMNESWQDLEEHLVDSQAKVYLRALSRYMGEYHSV